MPPQSAPPTPSMEWLEAANRLETVANQLASVVHEVNNMLQIVSGSAEMLGMAPDAAPAVLRRAAVIGSQTQRAAALLSEVLAFSREAPDTESVDLRDIVSRALALRQYAMGRAGIEARIDLCVEEALVRVNPQRLLQVVLNLILRSERALVGQSDAWLSVAVSREAGQVVFLIEDIGVGQGADGTMGFERPVVDQAGPAWLGIGVPVAAWISAQEGGVLSTSSRSGGGTTITLSLPAV